MSGMHLTASGTATRRLTGTGREAGDGAGGWSRDRYGRVRSRSTSGGGMTRREGGSGSELRCSCKDASTVPQTDEGRGGRIASGRTSDSSYVDAADSIGRDRKGYDTLPFHR